MINNTSDIKHQKYFEIMYNQFKEKNYENEIRYFLKTKMYNNKNVLTKNNKGKTIIKRLFKKIKQNPLKFISKTDLSLDKYRAISDFVSGMTDRYAINLYNDIK